MQPHRGKKPFGVAAAGNCFRRLVLEYTFSGGYAKNPKLAFCREAVAALPPLGAVRRSARGVTAGLRLCGTLRSEFSPTRRQAPEDYG